MSVGLEHRNEWLRAALLFLVFCALSARVLVPTGYMPYAGTGMTLTLCSGSGVMLTVKVDLQKSGQSDKATDDYAPCAFSASGMPLVSGVPPVLLASSLAYIIAHGTGSDAPAPEIVPVRLRPPLRAPPAV